MSSTSNSQNLLVNVFRPVYTYSAGSGFTPRLVLSNLDILSAGAVQTGNFAFGDINANLFIGSNAGGGSNNASNVGIGVGAMFNKTNSTSTVAIGTNSLQGATSATDTIAIGAGTAGGGTSNIILGANSGTIGSNMILLGPGLVTTGDVSGKLYIGAGNISNSLVYGDLNARRVGINTLSPQTTLDVSGDMRVAEWVSVGFSGPNAPRGAIDANGYIYANLGFQAQGGSATYPAYTFIDDSGTGFYQTNLGGFAITAQGNRLVDICGDTMFVYGNLKAFGSVNITSVDTSSLAFGPNGFIRDNAVNPNTDISATGIRAILLDASSVIQTTNGVIRVGPPSAPTVDISGSSIRAADLYATNLVQSPFVHDAAGTFDLSSGSLRLSSNLIVSNVFRTPGGAIRVGSATAPTIDISDSSIRVDGTLRAGSGTVAAPTHSFVADSSLGLYRVGANELGVASAGLQRMVISNDRVGIGRPVPSVTLDVSGDISANVYNGPGGTAAAPHYTFSDDRTTGVFFPAANIVGLTAGGVERMRISNAAVGIGTTAPTNALDVSGTLRVIGTGGTDITLSNGTVNATVAITISGTPIVSSNGSFSNAATTSNSIGGVVLSNSNAIVGGFLRNALTPNEFDISGGNLSNSATHTSSNFVGTASASNSIGGVVLSNSNAIVGGFLRNALTPSQFDISGGNISNSGTHISSNLRVGDGSVSGPSYSFTTDPSLGVYRVGTNQLGFASAGVQQMVISNSNVGIGTTTPSSLLTLDSRTQLGFSNRASTSPSNYQLSIFDVSRGGLLLGTYYTLASGSAGTIQSSDTFGNPPSVLGAALLLNPRGGNVGIGTTTPGFTLDISAGNTANTVRVTADAYPSIVLSGTNDTSSGQILYDAGVGTNKFILRGTSGTPITFETPGNAERMRIAANGNVGIGTTAPQFRLDVSSSDSATAIFRNAGSGSQASIVVAGSDLGSTGGLQFYHNAGLQGIYNNNSIPFTIWTNNARRMTILSNGNVGINQTNPDHTLDVNGSFSASNTEYTVYVNASGTVTVPSGFSKAHITLVGGGGGGGGGAGASPAGGAGGGGGGGGWRVEQLVTNPATMTIVIGNGGTAGTSSGNGGGGSNSTLTFVGLNSLTMYASGGSGGAGAATSNGGAGGAGYYGGGGGGGGYGGGFSYNGGTGGTGTILSGTSGQAGSIPGAVGGGGGAAFNGAAGFSNTGFGTSFGGGGGGGGPAGGVGGAGSNFAGSAGGPGSGGGGGGGGASGGGGGGGAGGNGFCIIRFLK